MMVVCSSWLEFMIPKLSAKWELLVRPHPRLSVEALNVPTDPFLAPFTTAFYVPIEHRLN